MYLKTIDASGLYFDGFGSGAKEERPCGIMAVPGPESESYDPGVLLNMFTKVPDGENVRDVMHVNLPLAIAERFCSMVENAEYVTADFWKFNECNSVNYWMMISWLAVSEYYTDPCYQSFGFGLAEDDRFALMIFRDEKRYTPGFKKPPTRYLAYLDSSEDLIDLASVIRSIVSELREKEANRYDS